MIIILLLCVLYIICIIIIIMALMYYIRVRVPILYIREYCMSIFNNNIMSVHMVLMCILYGFSYQIMV